MRDDPTDLTIDPAAPDPLADFRPMFAHLRATKPDQLAVRVRIPPSMARRLRDGEPGWQGRLVAMAKGFGFTALDVEVPEPDAMTGTLPAVLTDTPGNEAEWGRIIARLRIAGAGRLELGQCEHGWFARCTVPTGRATVRVEEHGHPTRLAAVDALADAAIDKSARRLGGTAKRIALPQAKARKAKRKARR